MILWAFIFSIVLEHALSFHTLLMLLRIYLLPNKGFSNGLVGKGSACYARDTEDIGSIPGWGRSLGGENGNPLQYSCLGNPRQFLPGNLMDRGASWAIVQRVTKSETKLNMSTDRKQVFVIFCLV